MIKVFLKITTKSKNLGNLSFTEGIKKCLKKKQRFYERFLKTISTRIKT